VEGSCEHGNEPSGSIKCWEPKLAASQQGLSSVKLVISFSHEYCFFYLIQRWAPILEKDRVRFLAGRERFLSSLQDSDWSWSPHSALFRGRK
jgi:hypothetical protein